MMAVGVMRAGSFVGSESLLVLTVQINSNDFTPQGKFLRKGDVLPEKAEQSGCYKDKGDEDG